MRDFYKLILIVPVMIVLAAVILNMGGGDIDIESGDGSIEVLHQGEDFDLRFAATAVAPTYNDSVTSRDLYIIPGTGPHAGIIVDLENPEISGTPVAQYEIGIDAAAFRASLGQDNLTNICCEPDGSDLDTDPDEVRDVQKLTFATPSPGIVSVDIAGDSANVTLTYGLNSGAARQIIRTNTAGNAVAWEDIPTELPLNAADDQVLTWDAGESPPGPVWEDAPTGLPAPGMEGQVLTLVSGAPEWADSTGGGQPGSTPANFTVYFGYTDSITPDTAEGYRTVLESSSTSSVETETLTAIQRATLTTPITTLSNGYPLFAWPTSEGAPDGIVSRIYLTPSSVVQATGTIEISGIDYEVWRMPSEQNLTFWQDTEIVLTWDLPAPVPAAWADPTAGMLTQKVTITATEFLTLDTTRITLIDAPTGSEKMIVVHNIMVRKLGAGAFPSTYPSPAIGAIYSSGAGTAEFFTTTDAEYEFSVLSSQARDILPAAERLYFNSDPYAYWAGVQHLLPNTALVLAVDLNGTTDWTARASQLTSGGNTATLVLLIGYTIEDMLTP